MRLLTEILNNVNAVQVIGNPEGVEISEVTIDSRAAGKGKIFVAIKGFKTDGHKFVPQAVGLGASAVVVQEDGDSGGFEPDLSGAVKIVVKNSRRALAQFSNALFYAPSEKLNLIGVTGTKGKTTTAFLIKNIFEYAGIKSGLIGTIANYIGGEEFPTKLTTPESHRINYLLNEMVNRGCANCVMEVSSHALSLHRTDFLNFDAAIFTNLTSDHMDFYETRSDYLSAKKILFDSLKPEAAAILNSDDDSRTEISKDTKAEIITFGQEGNPDYKISEVEYDFGGTTFVLSAGGKNYKIKSKLIGNFNSYNITAAFIAAKAFGIKEEIIVEAISSAPQVPGRFETISSGGKSVIVDYSHTADSLRKTLEAIAHVSGNKKKIYTVIGCGGDRDKTKRPAMGKIASDMSEKAFITSDNPRTEDPKLIIEDICSGIVKRNFEKITDREEAIKTAIMTSDEDSVILIGGKGHESYIEINGVRSYFSDKETAEKYLKLWNQKKKSFDNNKSGGGRGSG